MHRIASSNHQDVPASTQNRPVSGVFAKLRKVAIGFVMSAVLSVTLSSWNLSDPPIRNIVKFYLLGGYNMTIKSNFVLKSEKNNKNFT
jgi:hypothetical protein